MGHHTSKPVIAYVDAKDMLLEGDFQVLKAQFKRLSKNSKKINKNDFIQEILKPRLPGMSPTVLDRCFAVVDTNANGAIDFEDYIVALYVFQFGLREERFKLIFNMFDLDANYQISMKEFKKISLVMMENEEKKSNFSKEFNSLVECLGMLTLKNFDKNQDKELSYSEWRSFAEDDDIINKLVDSMRKVEFCEEDITAAAKEVHGKKYETV